MKNRNLLFNSATTAIAIVISLAIAFMIILFVSDSPAEAAKALLLGPFSSFRNFGSIITLASTITFTGLAVCIMFQASMFNMCAEGSFFIGALIAAAAATAFNMPPFIALMVPMLCGAAAGGLLCFVPAIMKAKVNANEMVSSLMLNYVALFVGLYLMNKYFRDNAYGALASHKLPEASVLDKIVPGTAIHSGVILAIILIVLCYLFLYKTKSGYEIRVMGQNAKFARYTGLSVGGAIILSQTLGGAIAGLGGAVEVMGMYARFQWTTLPGYGWDGVIIAILARNKPQFVPLAALFLAYLRVGANVMARVSDVPSEIITVIQAIMIMLVTATALLGRLKQKAVEKEVLANG
jgi:simple sugar transport system permease protein